MQTVVSITNGIAILAEVAPDKRLRNFQVRQGSKLESSTYIRLAEAEARVNNINAKRKQKEREEAAAKAALKQNKPKDVPSSNTHPR